MRICVGSTNEVKVNAVKEAIQDYQIFSNAEIIVVKVNSGVSDQPRSAEETIQGAINRARNAFKDCNYSFGIEDGLMKVPNTKTDYMNICACVIYDGKNFHLGLGPAFEYPIEVTRLVIEEGLDIDQAYYRAGLTDNPNIGSYEGVIGMLTKGKLSRKEYTKLAVMMALIHLENKNLYSKK